MTDRAPPRREDYAPYDKFDAFTQGITSYNRGQHRNPYDGRRYPGAGVDAQAWDRGREYAMRVQRFEALRVLFG